jgi:hypothetical protein
MVGARMTSVRQPLKGVRIMNALGGQDRKCIEALRLRANPAYRSVPWNRLALNARAGLAPAPDSFGVLLSADGQDLPPVVIDHDTALLFLALQDPGPAPDFAVMGERAADNLRRLIFDSILQVEQGGRFVTGIAASGILSVEDTREGDALAKLSIEALAYGAALAEIDAATLMGKLYTYNTRPATPALRRRLPDGAACLAFLGLARGGDVRNAAARRWTVGDSHSPWLEFQRREHQPGRMIQSCKLYIGLAFEALVERLTPIVETLGRHDTSQFKIGADLDGLLRPDKFVVYFPSKEALLATAQELLPIVGDGRLHTVPFTAAIARSGVLSWGMDPENAWFGERMSWRQWICEKLAAALIAARTSVPDAMAPWQFALERLRLEGVDPNTFIPAGSWSGES